MDENIKIEKNQEISSGEIIYRNFSMVDISNNIGKKEENAKQRFNLFKAFGNTRGYVESCSFNNGEPILFAFKKMLIDILFLTAVLVVVWVSFFLIKTTNQMISNDDISNMKIYSMYSESQNVEIDLNYSDNAYWVLEALGSTDLNGDATVLDIDTLYSGIQELFPKEDVVLAKNISNYDLLSSIYESIQDGMPVIVALSDTENDYFQYAIVSYIAPNKDLVKVSYSNGVSEYLSLDEFIEKTRYEDLESEKIDFAIGLNFGIYKVNTVIFIGEYYEEEEFDFWGIM